MPSRLASLLGCQERLRELDAAAVGWVKFIAVHIPHTDARRV
jgi:hypothetical protein